MNWLAHVFLSEHHIENQLANLLADPLKGKAWEGASKRFQQGLNTHKLIDSFTDAHPKFRESKARFEGKKYLKGVVVDILYDHFLTLHWKRYATVELEPFISTFHIKARDKVRGYPPLAKGKILHVIDINLLLSYGTLEGLEKGFKRIDKRLSDKLKAKETASSYMPLIEENIKALEEDFLLFFPDLMKHIYQHIEHDYLSHWNDDYKKSL